MSIERRVREWEGEHVLIRHDQLADAWIIVAIHSSVLGPATGGTRMRPYPDLEGAVADALRLSSGMTLKYAVSAFPCGGGKGVIFPLRPLSAEDRTALLRRYGGLIRELAGGFWTGPDVGTDSEDMEVIASRGAPYVFSRPRAAGGAGSSGPYTALGVFAGIEAACARIFGGSDPLRDRTVLIQGLGSVGLPLARHLHEAGARLVVSDVDERPVADAARDFGAEPLLPKGVIDRAAVGDVDVFAPCALGGVLTREAAQVLACRVVAGGANNQLGDPAVAQTLAERGVLYVPDFSINIGGAMAITGIEGMGWSEEDARARVVASARGAVHAILDRVEAEGGSTEDAARALAAERLASAAQAEPASPAV